ncbi:hypothetical protein RhiirC2_796520 [Rhizophagus irregularis]|uniref:Uncharacterized protein n=1 Tax=Rhizophagus irregularis TaxID=588596 RepID=A0A2N1M9K7_9GLOM|nr:hypothetical protein RhiirC2_796520 [Rhizophagus irregularis]
MGRVDYAIRNLSSAVPTPRIVSYSPADGELFSVVQSPKGHPPHCEQFQTEDTHLIANNPST